MSYKVTCPGCDSYTSGIANAVHRGEPCPYCGLPAETVIKVNRVREERGSEELRRQLSEALLKVGKDEAALAKLSEFVSTVREALAELDGPDA